MNDKAIEIYKETLKRVCDIDRDENPVTIISAELLPSGASRVLIEDDYGVEVYEYTDGVNYMSARDTGDHFSSYDDDHNNTNDIIYTFGMGLDESYVAQVADVLSNCMDWLYLPTSKLEDTVPQHLASETNLLLPEAYFLVSDFAGFDGKERLNLDIEQYIRERLLPGK